MPFQFLITRPVRMAAAVITRMERRKMPVLTATVLHGFTAAISRMPEGFFDRHPHLIDAFLVNLSAEIALPVFAKLEAKKPGYLAAAVERNAVLKNRLWQMEIVEFYSRLLKYSRLEAMAKTAQRMEAERGV